MPNISNNTLSTESINQPVVLEDRASIDYYRLLTLRAAINLERLGMHHSSGQSARKRTCQLIRLPLTTRTPKVIKTLDEILAQYKQKLTISQ
jgi:hypothetical protein